MSEEVLEYARPECRCTPRPAPPARVVCVCGHEIWDGEAVRSRCVLPASGEALCRCKRWVGVPVEIQPRESEPCRR